MTAITREGFIGNQWGRPDLVEEDRARARRRGTSFAIVMLERGFGIRDKTVDPYLKGHKVRKPRVAAEYNNIAQIKDLVAENADLITILPRPTVENDDRLGWSFISEITPRPVRFAYRVDHPEIVQRFLDCFTKSTKETR